MDNEKYSNNEINLRDYIEVIIKRKKIILIIFFMCVVGTIVISFLMPKTYETSTIVKIGSITQPLISGVIQPLIPKEEAILKLQREPLLNSVIRKLNLNIEVSGLKEMIEVENIKNTQFLKIKTQYTNPDLAVKICNAIANFFILQMKEMYDKKTILLNEQIKTLEKRNEILEKAVEKINQMLLSQTTNQDFPLMQNTLSNYETVFSQLSERIYLLKKELIDFQQFEILEPAVIAKNIKPDKKLNITVSAILGLMIGIFAAFLQEYWQRSK